MSWGLLKLPVFVVLWALMLALKLTVAALGFLVVPFLYPYRNIDYSKLPPWTRPWANPEDWYRDGNSRTLASLPPFWKMRRGTGFWAFYSYHAWRNPANGLRSFEFLDLDLVENQHRIRFVGDYLESYAPPAAREKGSPVWYLCWIGWQAAFYFVHPWNDDRHFVAKLGWRVTPWDKDHPPPKPHREDAGFASKLLPYRNG